MFFLRTVKMSVYLSCKYTYTSINKDNISLSIYTLQINQPLQPTTKTNNIHYQVIQSDPFHPLVGGHLTFPKGHLTIPKRVTLNYQVWDLFLLSKAFFKTEKTNQPTTPQSQEVQITGSFVDGNTRLSRPVF